MNFLKCHFYKQLWHDYLEHNPRNSVKKISTENVTRYFRCIDVLCRWLHQIKGTPKQGHCYTPYRWYQTKSTVIHCIGYTRDYSYYIPALYWVHTVPVCTGYVVWKISGYRPIAWWHHIWTLLYMLFARHCVGGQKCIAMIERKALIKSLFTNASDYSREAIIL